MAKVAEVKMVDVIDNKTVLGAIAATETYILVSPKGSVVVDDKSFQLKGAPTTDYALILDGASSSYCLTSEGELIEKPTNVFGTDTIIHITPKGIEIRDGENNYVGNDALGYLGKHNISVVSKQGSTYRVREPISLNPRAGHSEIDVFA
ncbi:MAG: hypothetical protein KAJ24_00105 [Candidatus Aenigmarchaeota archaeon]|nr:hypothetical protein [Candidatus Aenigmarchaeota archaeon]